MCTTTKDYRHTIVIHVVYSVYTTVFIRAGWFPLLTYYKVLPPIYLRMNKIVTNFQVKVVLIFDC